MNKLFLFVFFLTGFLSFLGSAQVKVTNLKCEHLDNPIGIDEVRPRFTWQIESEQPGFLQSAYQLAVGTEKAPVASGKGNFWESGTVNSSVIPVVYNGPELEPFTRYFWSIRIQDENGNWSDWSEVAFFESGMVQQTNWKGKWITDTYDYNVKPAPYFRKEFRTKKNVESARVYVAVAGLYELSVNGERIGDHRLDPTYTRFDRRNLYVTYDVTKNLQ
ncbi:MAG TPA: alpha-L-rhamnosidase N-terminal domain-containing protein, partial [Tangfeifania sp.]|nr:alpha-L-rhamnosidase N-terminal domain-containing protein [Tangfeifania sp.]